MQTLMRGKYLQANKKLLKFNDSNILILKDLLLYKKSEVKANDYIIMNMTQRKCNMY